MVIEHITVSVTTFKPWRPLPGNGDSHLRGWLENILQLKIANEVFILEMLDRGQESEIQKENLPDDDRIEVIPWLNDPPYADPTRQPVLDRAKNDWVLFIEDDERLSLGMIAFLNSLALGDPYPTRPWMAARFIREDYIFHNGLWRYIPANGQDHQIRLVDRHSTRWADRPHTTPEIDGVILTVNQLPCAILHYRGFDKIVSWTDRCNEMFSEMPQIVQMQKDYVDRVRQMLGF